MSVYVGAATIRNTHFVRRNQRGCFFDYRRLFCMQLLFDVLVEVDAERFDAQCQKNDADNEVYRFAHHSQ
jgi:hypothetical protein